MAGVGGINEEKWVAKLARIISDAPEEHRQVLTKVKMEISKGESVKGLGATTIYIDLLSETLGYIMDIQHHAFLEYRMKVCGID